MAKRSPSILLGRMSYTATLGLEIDGAPRAVPFCFSGLVQGSRREIWHVGSIRQRDIREAFHVAYTALALELTMILKGCKLAGS